MPSYDIVIAAGGLAGLSLACHLARSPLGAGSLLIVACKPATLQDRTWSYWTDQPSIFDPVVYHCWSHL
jgi:lycopene beta-cyclase